MNNSSGNIPNEASMWLSMPDGSMELQHLKFEISSAFNDLSNLRQLINAAETQLIDMEDAIMSFYDNKMLVTCFVSVKSLLSQIRRNLSMALVDMEKRPLLDIPYPKPSYKFNCTYVRGNSPSNFWVKTSLDNDNITPILREKLDNGDLKKMDNPNVGILAVVTQNDNIYRCNIIRKFDGHDDVPDKYFVQDIDSTLAFVVAGDSLYELVEEVSHVYPSCYNCCLDGVDADFVLPTELQNIFSSLLSTCSLKVTVIRISNYIPLCCIVDLKVVNGNRMELDVNAWIKDKVLPFVQKSQSLTLDVMDPFVNEKFVKRLSISDLELQPKTVNKKENLKETFPKKQEMDPVKLKDVVREFDELLLPCSEKVEVKSDIEELVQLFGYLVEKNQEEEEEENLDFMVEEEEESYELSEDEMENKEPDNLELLESQQEEQVNHELDEEDKEGYGVDQELEERPGQELDKKEQEGHCVALPDTPGQLKLKRNDVDENQDEHGLEGWNPMEKDNKEAFDCVDDNACVAVTGYNPKYDKTICLAFSMNGTCRKGNFCNRKHVTTESSSESPVYMDAFSVFKLPPRGGKSRIYITTVNSPFEFYGFFVNEYEVDGSATNYCMNVIKVHMNRQEIIRQYKKMRTMPLPGELIIVNIGSSWFRARFIMESEIPLNLMVFLVDFGTQYVVPLDDCRCMLKGCLQYPLQAVECGIANVDGKCMEKGSKLMKRLENEICVITVVDRNPVSRKLFVLLSHDDEDIGDKLINNCSFRHLDYRSYSYNDNIIPG